MILSIVNDSIITVTSELICLSLHTDITISSSASEVVYSFKVKEMSKTEDVKELCNPYLIYNHIQYILTISVHYDHISRI